MDEELLSAFCFLIVAVYMYIRFVRNPENEDKSFRQEDVAWSLPISNAIAPDYHGHVTRRRTHSSSGNDFQPFLQLDVQNYGLPYPRAPDHQISVGTDYDPRSQTVSIGGKMEPYVYNTNESNSIAWGPPANSEFYGQVHPAYSNWVVSQGQVPPPPFMMHHQGNFCYDNNNMQQLSVHNQIQMQPPQYQQCTSDSIIASNTPTITNPSMPSGPAQIQLEIAKKAQIPLFLHSPLFNRPSQSKKNSIELAETTSIPEYIDEVKIPTGGSLQALYIDSKEIELGVMIGQGAFGSVHKGMWRGTAVAVKILVCQNLSNALLEEFHAEVKIMSLLRHPNICLFMGACLEPPMRCLVVELVPRGSLWNVLRQNIVVDLELILKFANHTAQGMNYLHTFRPPILHRDLKSPNLLVDNSFGIKISDFGLARAKAHFQTMTGNCGTIQWMAPEVLAAQKYTEKADVYSFGIVCWETVTRQCPYDGLSQIQAALGVLNNNLRPEIPRNCPEVIANIIQKCWSTSPDSRPSFAQILSALGAVHP